MSRVALLSKFCLSLWFSVWGLSAVGAEATSLHEQTLTEAGVATTSEGLSGYLRQLHPSDEQKATVAELIRNLGSDDFLQRESATTRLMAIPGMDLKAMVEAAADDNPEVRARAGRILAGHRDQTERLLHAVFKTIETKRMVETLPEVLAALPHCEQQYIQHAARDALVAASRAEHAETLTTATTNDDAKLRVAATMALAAILGKGADSSFKTMLRDSRDEVRLAAARAMADYGSRAPLPALLDLLRSERTDIRAHGAMALRSLSGEHFGFAAYETAERRERSLKQWEGWVATSGAGADLRFPLAEVSHLRGNTLLAYGGAHKVVELDPEGKEVWSYDCQSPWYAEKLPTGNVIVVLNSDNKVIEVDRAGEIVWEFATEHPYTARMLPSGNLLIASMMQQKAFEVSRDKKIVWQYDAGIEISDARRLQDGTTLIGAYGGGKANGDGARLVTPEGKTIWDYRIACIYGCQALAKGNVLISTVAGEVLEVTPEKEVLWRFEEDGVAEANRLPNGNTLIAGYSRFVEIAPDKSVVWELKGDCAYGSAVR